MFPWKKKVLQIIFPNAFIVIIKIFSETPFPFETFPSFQFSKSGEILEEKEVMVRQDYKNTT